MILTFGERFKGLREDKNLTQTELGKELNMTQRKISYMENGQCEPSIQDIVSICKFFKVSSDYLLGLKSNRK